MFGGPLFYERMFGQAACERTFGEQVFDQARIERTFGSGYRIVDSLTELPTARFHGRPWPLGLQVSTQNLHNRRTMPLRASESLSKARLGFFPSAYPPKYKTHP